MSRPSATHCRDCNTELDILNSVYAGYKLRNRCKDCYNIYQNEWRKNNPENRKQHAKKNVMKNTYGLSEIEYFLLAQKHLNGCAICKQPETVPGKSLAVDHNHITNEVRGLLCHRCNVALGMLKEDEDIIWNMLEYLKRTTWNKEKAS